MNTGWVCPKCNRVHAPIILECVYCNDAQRAAPSIVPPVFPEPFDFPGTEIVCVSEVHIDGHLVAVGYGIQ